jgi:hypothetical protein
MSSFGDCTNLAFYGLKLSDENKCRQFYNDFIQLLHDHDMMPDKMAFRHNKKKHGYIKFATQNKKLLKLEFKNLESFELYSDFTEEELSIQDEKDGTSKMYFLMRQSKSLFVIQVRRILANDFEYGLLVDISNLSISVLNPDYGIGFFRNINYGPMFYVSGILQRPEIGSSMPEGEIESTICRWGDQAMPRELYNQGIIRNVYPENFLNSSQLRAKVDKVNLEEWITADAQRGTLKKINDKLSQWSVPEKLILPLRKELVYTGIIFNWARYQKENPEKV